MNRNTFREVAIPLVSLVLLIVIGYLAYDRIVEDRVTPLGPDRTQVSPTGAINVDPQAGSAILPGDLPVPGDARVTQSFDLATEDGDVQGTRSYGTNRSLADESAAYRAYLEAGRWTVADEQETDGYLALLAQRGDRQLLASFTERGGTTYVTVTATAASARN